MSLQPTSPKRTVLQDSASAAVAVPIPAVIKAAAETVSANASDRAIVVNFDLGLFVCITYLPEGYAHDAD